jgi:hypothetical protein
MLVNEPPKLHGLRAFHGLALASLLACRSSEAPPSAARGDTMALPSPPEASAGSAPDTNRVSEATGAALPWNWCTRTGSNIDYGYAVAVEVADSYWDALLDDCQTAGLVSDLNPERGADWFDYLVGYTYLMTGCPLFDEPPDGGISAFGPANLSAVGAAQPRLSKGDAQRVAELYADQLARVLELDSADRVALMALLLDAAESQVAATCAWTLSLCAGAESKQRVDCVDAGALDAGITDAGD